MGELVGAKCSPMRWAAKARPCDVCKTAAALLFCITDSSYMCMGCDSKIHCNRIHERVSMCEVCEQAPASVTCKADTAALCVRCDMDIHSANPLARRHERVPVTLFGLPVAEKSPTLDVPIISEDVDLFGSNDCKLSAHMKSIELLFSDPDNLLEFDYPVQTNHNHFEIDFRNSNIGSFGTSYTAPSISQNISTDVGVVPEGSCMSDISYPCGLATNNNVITNSCNNGNVQVSVGMDREARVMRYREKRKNRKFEKTIRYASRKAYAEKRPRIKGRFAKRSENTEDASRWFNSSQPRTHFVEDSGFGVVPSF